MNMHNRVMKNVLSIKQGIIDYNKVSKQVNDISKKWGIIDFLDYDDLMDLHYAMVNKGLENLGYTESQVEQIILKCIR